MKFVHAADLHLDAPFLGVAAADSARPGVAAALRRAAFDALDRLVELCLAERADFLVLAGDSFDRDEQRLAAQLAFAGALRRLGEAGIPTFVVRGNHDPLSGWSLAVEHHPLVHVFGERVEERLVAGPGGKPLARVLGRSQPERASPGNPAPDYRVDREPGLYTIGVLHASVGDSPGHSPYAPCSVEDLAATGLDYVALGHIHGHAVLSRAPWIVYPGCIQGRHIREAGPKGCCVVTVEAGKTDVRFVALDSVRWQALMLDASPLATLDAVRDAAAQVLREALAEADGRSLCVRLSVTGRSAVDSDLRARGTATDLLEVLRDDFGSGEPFAWIEELNVGTRPSADLDARAAQPDLLGLALQRAKSCTPSDLRGALGELLTHREMGRFLEEPSDEDLMAALEDAALLLLDRLEGGGA